MIKQNKKGDYRDLFAWCTTSARREGGAPAHSSAGSAGISCNLLHDQKETYEPPASTEGKPYTRRGLQADWVVPDSAAPSISKVTLL